MAGADSTIRVSIIGDAKQLGKTLDTADKKLGGFGKSLAVGVGAAVATDKILDFAQTALGEADRVGDALSVLEAQLGTDLVRGLDKAADGFSDLGLSRGDVLDLEAAIADTATALGIAKDGIADMAPDLVTAAGAIALISDSTPDEVIGLIGKAAAGSDKALRTLGINLTDAEVITRALHDTGKKIPGDLTDSEIAAARYKLILEKLAPKISAVTDASGDLEQSQSKIQAKFETLTGKIGEGLEGPLDGLLDWIISGIEGWEMFADRTGPVIDAIGDVAQAALDAAPDLGVFGEALGNILGTLGDMLRLDFAGLIRRLNGVSNAGKGLGEDLGGLGGGGGSSIPGVTGPTPKDSHQSGPGSIVRAETHVTINVPPTGAQTEAAVVRAIRDYEARNGPMR